MPIIGNDVLQFLQTVQPRFTGWLGELQNSAMEAGYPVIPPETARLLAVLVTIKQPKKILEIGCAVGFSASLMASHMPRGGTVTTIDRYQFMIDRAKENFKRFGLNESIELLEGDAKNILPELKGPYDFIFLDAGKAQYINFLPHCLRLLAEGGVLAADNVLQGGTIAGDECALPRRQRHTYRRMNEFLERISNTEGLETSIVPIGDGLSLTVKTASYTG